MGYWLSTEFLETAGQERWQTVLMEDIAEPSGPWSMHRLLARPSTISRGTFFFSLFYFLLAYTCFMMLCQFLLCSKVNQSHTSPLPCISFPFRSPQSIEFPVLYSQFLLAMCFINSSVYMLIPISQSIPPLPPWYPYVYSLHLCLYFCFADKFIYTIFQIPHICVNIQYLLFSFLLTSLCMKVSRPSVNH